MDCKELRGKKELRESQEKVNRSKTAKSESWNIKEQSNENKFNEYEKKHPTRTSSKRVPVECPRSNKSCCEND